ncbi:MAG: TetR/AcrR family transcriptional regulator [Acetobacteraceae bacterium]|nr:TetR/AcrR family transcriptional regulator [Acetobacteraceae bacterium]
MRNEVLTFKRERILSEASALFYERGFTATTLDDIAARLGVTKPFIYGHFRSKADLLAAVCRPPLELTLAAAARVAKAEGTNSDRLKQLIAELTSIFLEHRSNVSIYARDALSLEPPARSEIESLKNRRNRVIMDLLRSGVTAREFDVDDLSAASLALFALIAGVPQAAKNGSNRTVAENTPEEIAKLALRMVGARDGKLPRSGSSVRSKQSRTSHAGGTH